MVVPHEARSAWICVSVCDVDGFYVGRLGFQCYAADTRMFGYSSAATTRPPQFRAQRLIRRFAEAISTSAVKAAMEDARVVHAVLGWMDEFGDSSDTTQLELVLGTLGCEPELVKLGLQYA